jgi:predicted nucleic acid-binding protein
MNGKRVLLDTNAIIAFLRSNQEIVDHVAAKWVGISIISEIEFMSYRGLSAKDRKLFANFIIEAEVIDLRADNRDLMDTIIHFRRDYKIKLPDAIVAATAWHYFDRTIITADKEFTVIPGLNVLTFNP